VIASTIRDDDQTVLISFTKQEFVNFKKLCNKTPDKGVFTFKGYQFLKEYAKYLIEFLEKKS
jgi:hypothetical protein